MAKLKEEAKAYEPPQTKNIADLDKVSIDIDLKDGEGIDKNNQPFRYKYVEIDGVEYRVPGTVIGQIKAILEKMPNIKHISVTKTGEGMSTRYHAMPYYEDKVQEEKVE